MLCIQYEQIDDKFDDKLLTTIMMKKCLSKLYNTTYIYKINKSAWVVTISALVKVVTDGIVTLNQNKNLDNDFTAKSLSC